MGERNDNTTMYDVKETTRDAVKEYRPTLLHRQQ
jgi:hypothetical protein